MYVVTKHTAWQTIEKHVKGGSEQRSRETIENEIVSEREQEMEPVIYVRGTPNEQGVQEGKLLKEII